MPNIFDEVKIIFRGPCERLFIAYKPLGWHVCSPSGKKKMDDSLSSVLGAKLGISEDSIKFPSKLKINQKGLVIGTTDTPMYNQITKIIEKKECSKTYSCLIEDSVQSFLSKTKDFNILLENPSNLNDLEVSGTINFNLMKLKKNSQIDPDVSITPNISVTPTISFNNHISSDTLVHNQPQTNTTPSNSYSTTSSNSSTNNYSLSYSISNSTSNLYSIKFKINNLINILNNNDNYYYNTKQIKNIDKNKYSTLELETRDKLVDKFLMEILDKIGVKLVDQYDSKLNETHKTMHLNKIQLPHPILRDRRITTSIPIPLDTWIQHLSQYN